jgi:hypothetical protein
MEEEDLIDYSDLELNAPAPVNDAEIVDDTEMAGETRADSPQAESVP